MSAANMEFFKRVLAPLPQSLFKKGSEFQVYNNYYPGDSSHVDHRLIAGVSNDHKSFTLFPKWLNMGDEYRKEYFLFHELSHVIDLKKGSISKQKEWLSFSGWEMHKYKEWKPKNKKNLPSLYVVDAIKADPANGPEEDFADSIAAYR